MDPRKKIILVQEEMRRLSNIAISQRWPVTKPNRILSVLLDNYLDRPWIDALNPTLHPVPQLSSAQLDDLLAFARTCITPNLFRQLVRRSRKMHKHRFDNVQYAFVIKPKLGKKVGDIIYIESHTHLSVLSTDRLTFTPNELTLYPLSPVPSSPAPAVVAVHRTQDLS